MAAVWSAATTSIDHNTGTACDWLERAQAPKGAMLPPSGRLLAHALHRLTTLSARDEPVLRLPLSLIPSSCLHAMPRSQTLTPTQMR